MLKKLGPRPSPDEICFDDSCFKKIGERTYWTVGGSLASGAYRKRFDNKEEAEEYAKRSNQTVYEHKEDIKERISWTKKINPSKGENMRHIKRNPVRLHNTFKPDTYYTNFQNLPKEAQKILLDTPVEVERSSYTAYESTAFIRNEVSFDDRYFEAEITLGSVDIKNSDYKYDDELGEYVDDEGRVIDSEEYAESMAEELPSYVEIENLDVYLTEIDAPKISNNTNFIFVKKMEISPKSELYQVYQDVISTIGGKTNNSFTVQELMDEHGMNLSFYSFKLPKLEKYGIIKKILAKNNPSHEEHRDTMRKLYYSDRELQEMSPPQLLQLIRSNQVSYNDVDRALEKIKAYRTLDWIGDKLSDDEITIRRNPSHEEHRDTMRKLYDMAKASARGTLDVRLLDIAHGAVRIDELDHVLEQCDDKRICDYAAYKKAFFIDKKMNR